MMKRWLWPILVVLVLLHGLAAVVWIPRLSFHADLSVESDQDPRVALARAKEAQFPAGNPVVVVAADAPARDRWGSALAEAGLKVRTTTKARAELSPLETRMFLTSDQSHWLIFVPTEGDGQREAAIVARLLAQAPDTTIGGAPWVRRLVDQALVANVSWLVPGSLLALWLAFLALTRRLGAAAFLTGFSCLPALGLVLLFPVLGLSVNFTTLLAPLLTLALATTYTLHIDHHLREKGPDWTSLVRHRGQAVFWSATISAVGFSSLWFSPISTLRSLGGLLVLGLALTLFWVLIALPLVSGTVKLHRRPTAVLPLGSPHRWGRWLLGALALAALVGVAGTTTAIRWSDFLSEHSTEGRWVGAFEKEVPGWQEATLHLAWDDGTWLDGDRWDRLSTLIDRWRQSDPDLSIWSVQDAVAGILETQDMAREEALEFLPPTAETGKLINAARTEIVVRFGIPTARLGPGQFDFNTRVSDAKLALTGVDASWSGSLYRQIVGMESFLWGEAQGMAVFYLVTLSMITIRLRSWKRGILAVWPALLTGLFLLGLAGWLRWPMSPATALVAAACLGQSTDDGLLWSLLPHTAEVRSSLAESTILLVAGLSVLLTSSFTNIVQAGLLVILSLSFSTAVVLWALPWKRQPSGSVEEHSSQHS